MKKRRFIPLSQPLFGQSEKKAVIKAMESGWVTLGPKTSEFEEAFKTYVGSAHAVAVSSATAGIHLAMIAAGIGKGDEVIAPTFTFAATINPIIHVGAIPILVDVDRNTFLINVKEIEKKITKKTKAIIPVHYAGQPADMDEIMRLAKKYSLLVIEDAAHATGTEYKGKKVGSIGDMSIFSFHPIKNMTTGDGGMVTTNNPKYDEMIRLYRLHGMNKEAWKRLSKSGSWFYEITAPGFKYNMTDISASIGIEQLKKLENFNKIRSGYAEIYNQEFLGEPNIITPLVLKSCVHSWNLYSILLKVEKMAISRDEFIEELKKENIGSSVYFMPLHMHPYYRDTYHYSLGDFPNAEWIYERLISIPMCPAMTKEEVPFVARTIKNLVKKFTKHG